jgi:dipeptide/tripeptide permease
MGAFLFPLILVPILKSMNPTYVIIASGICTAAMLIPTALFFKEPTRQKEVEENTKKREQTSLLQTLANAFEIIYSPIVLLHNAMKKSGASKIIIILLLIVLLGYSGFQFFQQKPASESFAAIGIEKGDTTLIFTVERDMLEKDPYKLEADKDKIPPVIHLTIYKPRFIDEFAENLLKDMGEYLDLASVTREEITQYIKTSDEKIELIFELDTSASSEFKVEPITGNQYKVVLKDLDGYEGYRENLLEEIHQNPTLRGITLKNCNRLHEELKGRSFFLFFVISLILIGLIIVAVSTRSTKEPTIPDTPVKSGFQPSVFIVPLVILGIWFLPGVGPLGKIICSVIYLSIMSLFIIDKTDTQKFVDHAKFLLMIVLYSGFWVLYFQMFDSVLWYVQAYVDASSLNNAVNNFLGLFGIKSNLFFDVEHITVINAGTIIVLQLIISSIVKNKKAMPTMITGIVFATLGMAMLAVSTHIWVFIAGIVIFSIGEMTAHPKFISYVGLTAPSDKKAMYMGYIFLYGVFGSSVGGIVGAKLYVHFVDTLNQPRTLWIVFSMIGVVTIISLLLYNKFLAPKKVENSANK